MSGILDGYGSQQGGILGNGAMGGGNSGLGLWGAALMDVSAHLAGKPRDATNLAQFQQQGLRQKLIAGLTSQDPNERQQAYQIAPLLGIDPSAFQKGQASQAMPRLLNAMQPQLNPVNVTPQMRPQDSTNDPSRQAAYNAPDQVTPSLTDALQSVNSPELSAQMAPQIIAAAEKANEPFNLSPGQHRFVGSQEIAALPEKNNPNAAFNADGSPNKAYQDYEAGKLRASQAPAWARLKMDEGDAGGGLSDAAKINAAVKFNLTGTLPAFGMGKAARGDRLEVMNYAAQLATGKKTPEQLVADSANYKANSRALNLATSQFNAIEQNSNAAKNSLNLALKSAQDGGVGPSDSPVFNRWVQAGRVAVSGDPKVQALQNHLGTFAEEYAKVMTASTGSAAATDSARAEAYKRLSGANSYANMQEIANGMLQEMGGRHYAARAQIENIQGQLGGKAYAAPKGVETAAPSTLPQRPIAPAGTSRGVKWSVVP